MSKISDYQKGYINFYDFFCKTNERGGTFSQRESRGKAVRFQARFLLPDRGPYMPQCPLSIFQTYSVLPPKSKPQFFRPAPL